MFMGECMIILLQIQKINSSDILTFIGFVLLLTILICLVGLLEYKLKGEDDEDDDYSTNKYY